MNSPCDVTTTTADLTRANLIFNSVLSTKNAKFMCKDIANLYLKNTMDIYLVYETTARQYTRVNHPTIQYQKLSAQKFCIYGNTKVDVWTN